MHIRKINQNEELEVTVEKVRLPSLDVTITGRNECKYIDRYSFSNGNGDLYMAFFKEFVRNKKEFYSSTDAKYQPVFGNEYNCNGVIDLIPVIEIKETLEVDSIYITNNIPFIAATENKLVCLTRVNCFMVGENCQIGFKEACDYIDYELDIISHWY